MSTHDEVRALPEGRFYHERNLYSHDEIEDLGDRECNLGEERKREREHTLGGESIPMRDQDPTLEEDPTLMRDRIRRNDAIPREEMILQATTPTEELEGVVVVV